MTNVFTDGNIFQDVSDAIRQKEVLQSAVDFYGIFDVIYKLFDKLGVLSDQDNAKLNFIFAYPDKPFEDETRSVVTFDLLERKRLKYETSAGSITQEKPRELVSQKDIVSGQIETFYSHSYENIITLDVYSTSSERMYQILSYLESVFTKSFANNERDCPFWWNENQKNIATKSTANKAYKRCLISFAIAAFSSAV